MNRLLLLASVFCAAQAQAEPLTDAQKFQSFFEVMKSDSTPMQTFCINVHSTFTENPNGWGQMFTRLPEDQYPWEKCEKQWRKLNAWFDKKQDRDRKRARVLLCDHYPPEEEVPLRLQTYEDGAEEDTARVMRRFYRLIGKERAEFLRTNIDHMSSGDRVDAPLPDDLHAYLNEFCEVNR